MRGSGGRVRPYLRLYEVPYVIKSLNLQIADLKVKHYEMRDHMTPTWEKFFEDSCKLMESLIARLELSRK